MSAMANPATSNGDASARSPSRWRAPSREARDTLFMVALIGWTIAPHLFHLPLWVTGLAGLVLAWRGWLAWRQAPLPGRTAIIGLLGLAAWIVAADLAGHSWGLMLPGIELAPDNGTPHRHAALQALAQW